MWAVGVCVWVYCCRASMSESTFDAAIYACVNELPSTFDLGAWKLRSDWKRRTQQKTGGKEKRPDRGNHDTGLTMSPETRNRSSHRKITVVLLSRYHIKPNDTQQCGCSLPTYCQQQSYRMNACRHQSKSTAAGE